MGQFKPLPEHETLSAMPPPLLLLQDISLSFGTTPVLAGAGLAVGAGDRLCLVGRNGSGKSTLLRIAAGLVQKSVQKLDRARRQIEGRRFARSRLPNFRNRIIIDFLIDKSPLEFAARLLLARSGHAVLQTYGHPITVGERYGRYERHLLCTFHCFWLLSSNPQNFNKMLPMESGSIGSAQWMD